MSEQIAIELLRMVGVFVAAWFGVRVELRWLRADVERHEQSITHLLRKR